MSSTIIDRLCVENAWTQLDRTSFEPFIDDGGFSVVLCSEDPARYPESVDVAVVLPELLVAAPVRLKAAVAHRDFERELQQRYDFHAWPALLFFQAGRHLGTIVRMHDWSEFQKRMERILPTPHAVDAPVDDQRRA